MSKPATPRRRIIRRTSIISAAATTAAASMFAYGVYNARKHQEQSHPWRIPVACQTLQCQETAAEVKNATQLWKQAAASMGWKVPAFINEDFELRRAGIESAMGSALHSEGSSYEGVLQFSKTKPESLYLTNIKTILPIMNVVQQEIPALKNEEIAEGKHKVAAAQLAVQNAKADLISAQSNLAKAVHRSHASAKKNPASITHPAGHIQNAAYNKTDKQHPVMRGAVVTVNLEVLRAKVAKAKAEFAASQSQLVKVKAQKHFPVTKETLDNVFDDPTVQVFMDLTLARQDDIRLRRAFPRYKYLSDADKDAVHYIMHNSPMMGRVLAENLEIHLPPENPVKHFFRIVGQTIGVLPKPVLGNPDDTKRTIDELSREAAKDIKRKQNGYHDIFQANSGLYEKEGHAFPREIVERYKTLTDPYVKVYGSGAPKPSVS